MEGGTHKGKSANGLQNPECCPVFLKNMSQGPQTSWRENALQELSRVSLWLCPPLAQSLGELDTAAFDLWVRMKNKTKKNSLGRERRLAARQEEGWCWFYWPQGLARPDWPACPHRRQCVRSWQSRAQLRPFRNKYCFRPKCVDLRKLHLSLAMQIVPGEQHSD